MKFTAGKHLGIVRAWMQRKCINGERVTWGSQEMLVFSGGVTVWEMEHLAQSIRNAVAEELLADYMRKEAIRRALDDEEGEGEGS